MNILNSVIPQVALPQHALAADALGQSATKAPGAAVPHPHNPPVNTNAQAASGIEYEMFADEGDRFSREERGLSSKLFKKKNPGVPDSSTPHGNKSPEVQKTGGSNAPAPGGSGSGKFDQDIIQEQAEFEVGGSYSSKLGSEEVSIVVPTSSTLYVPGANVNGKAVSPFSNESLKKAKQEFEDAIGVPDGKSVETPKLDDASVIAPVKPPLSDTKKAVIALAITGLGGAVVTAIVELIKKYVPDDAAAKIKTTLADTKIVDQLQNDVFETANLMAILVGSKEIKTDLEWAKKSDEQRMTSLESIVLELEKGFGKLAKEFDIPVTFALSRSEDTSIEGRAKNIGDRLAVIVDVSLELAPHIKASRS